METKCVHEWYWNWIWELQTTFNDTAYTEEIVSSIYCRKCWEIEFKKIN